MLFSNNTLTMISGHPYEPLIAASGIDSTIKIFSPDQQAQYSARNGINLGISSHDPLTHSSLSFSRLQRRAPPACDPTNDESESVGPSNENSNDDDSLGPPRHGGLASRKRMHNSYQIISQNDAERQGGIREAIITVGEHALSSPCRCREIHSLLYSLDYGLIYFSRGGNSAVCCTSLRQG